MEAGKFWAHRARVNGPVARVEVLRVGTKRPPRVKVRFTADEEEGREAWVPCSQLHVPWEQAECWLARERRWKELSAATPPDDVPERRAVDTVFEACPWDELASVGYSRHDDGVLYVHEVTAFAEALEESTDFLIGEVIRLGRIVEQAVGMLRQAGRDKDAARIEAQFEIPVEVFRRMQPPG